VACVCVMRWFYPVCSGAIIVCLSQLTASADGDNPAVAIQGASPAVCIFAAPQSGQASNMILGPTSATQNSISVTKLADSTTAQLLPASITVTSKGVCNHAHAFKIASKNGGLHTGTNAPGFANHVNYTAVVSWGGMISELSTSGLSGQTTPSNMTTAAYAGNMQLQILIPEDGASRMPLLAGQYADDLTITFGPQM
jgi:hypothetical protein